MRHEQDRDYRRLINTGRWRRLRLQRLKEHPACEKCEQEGFVTAATEVHHRVPVSHGVTFADKERLMFNPSNLEALCEHCHIERHIAMRRSGKGATRRRLSAQGDEIRRRFFGDE